METFLVEALKNETEPDLKDPGPARLGKEGKNIGMEVNPAPSQRKGEFKGMPGGTLGSSFDHLIIVMIEINWNTIAPPGDRSQSTGMAYYARPRLLLGGYLTNGAGLRKFGRAHKRRLKGPRSSGFSAGRFVGARIYYLVQNDFNVPTCERPCGCFAVWEGGLAFFRRPCRRHSCCVIYIPERERLQFSARGRSISHPLFPIGGSHRVVSVAGWPGMGMYGYAHAAFPGDSFYTNSEQLCADRRHTPPIPIILRVARRPPSSAGILIRLRGRLPGRAGFFLTYLILFSYPSLLPSSSWRGRRVSPVALGLKERPQWTGARQSFSVGRAASSFSQ